MLRGFTVMGVNQKKINRMILLKENQRKYQEFIKTLDLKPIVEYFELGIEARQFTDAMTGRVLTKNDNLFWGFNSEGYQYTLRRQPLNTSGNDMSSIMNELLQGRNKVT
jgi:hypothetical protein